MIIPCRLASPQPSLPAEQDGGLRHDRIAGPGQPLVGPQRVRDRRISPDTGKNVHRVPMLRDNGPDVGLPTGRGQVSFPQVRPRKRRPPLGFPFGGNVLAPDARDRSAPSLAEDIERAHLVMRGHVLPEYERGPALAEAYHGEILARRRERGFS